MKMILFSTHFYPRDSILARYMLRHFRLCVTHMLCIKTAKSFIEILLPSDSPILIFRHWGSWLNSDGFTPMRGTKYKGVRKLGNFWRESRCILETVWNTAIVAIEVEHETIPKLLNSGTFNDLEWPQPPVSISPYSSKANILQTVHATAIVAIELE